MIDYREEDRGDGVRYKTFPMVVRWVIPNSIRSRVPIKAQGFLGAWSGRDDQHYFPAVGYTTTLKYTYESLDEARVEALSRVDAEIAKLEEARAEILAATDRASLTL